VTQAASGCWSPPTTCDQCPHPIAEHALWEPDAVCAGWMHCTADKLLKLLAQLASTNLPTQHRRPNLAAREITRQTPRCRRLVSAADQAW
jgi:hypothetical protein